MSDYYNSNDEVNSNPFRQSGYTYDTQTQRVLDSKTYNLTITGCLVWGFFVIIIICRCVTDFFAKMNPKPFILIILLIGCFVCAIAGKKVIRGTASVLFAFLGYNLLVLPVGVVLSVFPVDYSISVVQYAFLAVILVTFIMAVMSYIYPQSFLSMGMALGMALIALMIVVSLLSIVFKIPMGVLELIVVIIFSLFIGYDLAKSQRKRFTYVNAVVSAAEFYLDIGNLFIRIVSIIIISIIVYGFEKFIKSLF